MILTDKVAIVTGASRGIGAATAELLAAQGAKVAINYHHSREQAEGLLASIREKNGQAMLIQGDVTDPAQVRCMVSTVSDELGPVDILVCNANMHFAQKSFLDMPWDEFEHKLASEMKASFLFCKEVAPAMIQRRSGSIVLVSSGLSHHPGPYFIAHSCAKAALNAFSRSLAQELGPFQVRVNVVSPGLTMTDATAHIPSQARESIARMTPLQRIALPHDIAGAILYYCTDWAGFVTGTYLPVSGGSEMQ